MKQHLELPDGNRVFSGIVVWGYELTPLKGESFECIVIAETEEQAKALMLEACLADNPNFKNRKWVNLRAFSPILFYY